MRAADLTTLTGGYSLCLVKCADYGSVRYEIFPSVLVHPPPPVKLFPQRLLFETQNSDGCFRRF